MAINKRSLKRTHLDIKLKVNLKGQKAQGVYIIMVIRYRAQVMRVWIIIAKIRALN